MTVSRVVNHDANVQQQTREKVQAAIEELGYVPNPAARSLAAGRQCRIALLHSNPSAAYLSEFLVGCLAQASQANAPLVVEQFEPGDPAAGVVARIRAHRANAVVLISPMSNDPELIGALHAARIRIALVGAGQPTPREHFVGFDDEAAATAVMEHLLALGHRRIGFITGNPGHLASGRRRVGYEMALRGAGLGVDPACIVPGDFTYRSGLAATEALLDRPQPPTAIFASNDDMAAAAVAVAHRRHLSVPDDLSICGFDDTAMATTIWPELTTIRQPIAETARQAVALLVEDAESDDPGAQGDCRSVQLPFELIVRGSTGPVRRR